MAHIISIYVSLIRTSHLASTSRGQINAILTNIWKKNQRYWCKADCHSLHCWLANIRLLLLAGNLPATSSREKCSQSHLVTYLFKFQNFWVMYENLYISSVMITLDSETYDLWNKKKKLNKLNVPHQYLYILYKHMYFIYLWNWEIIISYHVYKERMGNIECPGFIEILHYDWANVRKACFSSTKAGGSVS